MRINQLKPIFVEYIPLELEEGFLYISMKYATASHLCACGCGEKVVTPISKRAWSLLFNGEGITLSPSIGNYEQACKSHYFIQENCIIWCGCHRNKIGKPSKAKRKNKKRWFKFWSNRSDDR